MSIKRPRVIGTTDSAIERAEKALCRKLPQSFRLWLLQNNGLGVEDITIFPVQDDRDIRMTWDSINRRFEEGWKEWLANFECGDLDFTHLLPFADFGSGDYYCFDYSRLKPDGEAPVVRWSHETGKTDDRANSFSEFAAKAKAGEFKAD
jgi:hypothetical protein